MFNTSITQGIMAITRLSTAAVVQVVQPRFDPPATTKRSTFTFPPSELAQKVVMVSMARTAALVIGSRAGHLVSPVRRNLSQLYAISESSVRPWVSPANTRGWFGTIFSSLTTDLVASAIFSMLPSADLGDLPSLAPPEIKRKDCELVTLSGFTMITQCFQSGRSTSLVVSQAWEVISRMKVVSPSPGTLLTR